MAYLSPVRDKQEVVFEFHTGRDSLGRCWFTAHWWDEHFHTGPSYRGQGFMAIPEQYVHKWKRIGRTVRCIGVPVEMKA